jgi:hypothetical protein
MTEHVVTHRQLSCINRLHIGLIYFPFSESDAILKFCYSVFEITVTEKELRIYFASYILLNKHLTNQKW